MKQRLDQELFKRGLVSSRSQAESYIKLGQVKVNNVIANKAGILVQATDKLEVTAQNQYVSRAALKLASAAQTLQLNFKNKLILDVGSSTGGFTQFALKNGARKVIAVDVGTNQMHPSIRLDNRVELHEQTDIRSIKELSSLADIVLIDVSFISLREVLPHISLLISHNSQVVAMVKPQFEAGDGLKHRGVIKNEKIRRNILKSFENWVQNLFIIKKKADSGVSGSKGNLERFYLLQPLNFSGSR